MPLLNILSSVSLGLRSFDSLSSFSVWIARIVISKSFVESLIPASFVFESVHKHAHLHGFGDLPRIG